MVVSRTMTEMVMLPASNISIRADGRGTKITRTLVTIATGRISSYQRVDSVIFAELLEILPFRAEFLKFWQSVAEREVGD